MYTERPLLPTPAQGTSSENPSLPMQSDLDAFSPHLCSTLFIPQAWVNFIKGKIASLSFGSFPHFQHLICDQ